MGGQAQILKILGRKETDVTDLHGRASPDVHLRVAQGLDVREVANDDLVVHIGPQRTAHIAAAVDCTDVRPAKDMRLAVSS